MNNSTYDYVIKTTSNTLDLIRNKNDPLLKQLNIFISGNLGIHVNLYQTKYKVLAEIEDLYEERKNKIEEAGLIELQKDLINLDRNREENTKYLENKYHFLKNVHLCPSKDSHCIIDEVLRRLI